MRDHAEVRSVVGHAAPRCLALHTGRVLHMISSQLSCLQIRGTVKRLLTPYPYRLLADSATLPQLCATLTSTAATPLVLWTAKMRESLREAVAPQLDQNGDGGEGAVDRLADFEHAEAARELQVEEVYVRLLVEVWTFLWDGMHSAMHFAYSAQRLWQRCGPGVAASVQRRQMPPWLPPLLVQAAGVPMANTRSVGAAGATPVISVAAESSTALTQLSKPTRVLLRKMPCALA